VFWLVMDLVRAGVALSLDLAAAKKLVVRPSTSAFGEFLARVLAFSTVVVPLLMGDLKPANITSTSARQGFLLLDVDPHYNVWLFNVSPEYKDTIRLSNLLSFVANSCNRTHQAFLSTIWQFVQPLLTANTGEETFRRCVDWWYQSLSGGMRKVRTQFCQARHYLKNYTMPERVLDRMPAGYGPTWLTKETGRGGNTHWWDNNGKPRDWDSNPPLVQTSSIQVRQFLIVLVRLAAWWDSDKLSWS